MGRLIVLCCAVLLLLQAGCSCGSKPQYQQPGGWPPPPPPGPTVSEDDLETDEPVAVAAVLEPGAETAEVVDERLIGHMLQQQARDLRRFAEGNPDDPFALDEESLKRFESEDAPFIQ